MKLTKKKQEWAKRFKPNVLTGTALQYNVSIEDRYYRELSDLVKQMADETKKELIKEFKTKYSREYFAMDESISSQSRILVSALKKRFDQLFNKKAKGLALSMLNQTEKASSGALHQSLKQLSGGLSLGTRVFSDEMNEIMKASIAENVSLIKSIPQDFFTQIEGAVMRSITTGNGLKDLVPFVNNYKGVTLRRARLIAGDQSRKAYSNITASKMKTLGVKKYRWIHSSAAQEPRPLHVKLNGTIQSLDDPPIIQYAKGKQPQVRGNPGALINCSCIMQPIVEFGDE